MDPRVRLPSTGPADEGVHVERRSLARAIAECLRDLGLHESSSTLEREARVLVDSESARGFIAAYPDGAEPDRALGGVERVSWREGEVSKSRARFGIALEMYSRCLKAGDLVTALAILRDRLAPHAPRAEESVDGLACLLLLPRESPALAREVDRLREKWTEIVYKDLDPEVSVPRKRLLRLIAQGLRADRPAAGDAWLARLTRRSATLPLLLSLQEHTQSETKSLLPSLERPTWSSREQDPEGLACLAASPDGRFVAVGSLASGELTVMRLAPQSRRGEILVKRSVMDFNGVPAGWTIASLEWHPTQPAWLLFGLRSASRVGPWSCRRQEGDDDEEKDSLSPRMFGVYDVFSNTFSTFPQEEEERGWHHGVPVVKWTPPCALLSTGPDARVCWWALSADLAIRLTRAWDAPERVVDFAPLTPTSVCLACVDGTLRWLSWSEEEGVVRAVKLHHATGPPPRWTSLDARAELVTTAEADGAVAVWDVLPGSTERDAPSLRFLFQSTPILVEGASSKLVAHQSVAAPGGEFVAVGGGDGRTRVWSVLGAHPARTYDCLAPEASDANPEKTHALEGQEATVRKTKTTRRRPFLARRDARRVNAIAWTPSATRPRAYALLAVGDDGVVRLFDDEEEEESPEACLEESRSVEEEEEEAVL